MDASNLNDGGQKGVHELRSGPPRLEDFARVTSCWHHMDEPVESIALDSHCSSSAQD